MLRYLVVGYKSRHVMYITCTGGVDYHEMYDMQTSIANLYKLNYNNIIKLGWA